MNIDINLELKIELNSIIGPIILHKENGTSTTAFYIEATNKSSGHHSEVFVRLTENTTEAIAYGGWASYSQNTIEALIVQQLLKDLLKDAGASIEADLEMLWTNGYINTTPEETDLIKTLLREKRNNLLKEY